MANKAALMGPGKSHEHYTPSWLLDICTEIMDGICLDPCGNQHGPPSVVASRVIRPPDDALAMEWEGRSIFMNPPYGREIGFWVAKLLQAFDYGGFDEAIALLPARMDTKWWGLISKFPIVVLRGRLKFLVPELVQDGDDSKYILSEATTGAPFPSVLVYLAEPWYWHKFTEATHDLGAVYLPYSERSLRHVQYAG